MNDPTDCERPVKRGRTRGVRHHRGFLRRYRRKGQARAGPVGSNRSQMRRGCARGRSDASKPTNSRPTRDRIRALAGALQLDGEKLVGIANGWAPEHGNAPHDDARLSVERTILDAGMEVNAYAMKCNATGEGAIVDAGGQAERILALAQQMRMEVTHVLLTHGHGDHVGALAEVAEATRRAGVLLRTGLRPSWKPEGVRDRPGGRRMADERGANRRRRGQPPRSHGRRNRGTALTGSSSRATPSSRDPWAARWVRHIPVRSGP